MRWQDKLTKEERDHVRDFAGRTLAGFKRNREAQKLIKINREKFYGDAGSEPCWLCRAIARKLGLEEIKSND